MAIWDGSITELVGRVFGFDEFSFSPPAPGVDGYGWMIAASMMHQALRVADDPWGRPV